MLILYVNFPALNAVFYHFKFISTSVQLIVNWGPQNIFNFWGVPRHWSPVYLAERYRPLRSNCRQHWLRRPCAEVRHQKHRTSLKIRCKYTSKVNNVFLFRWKFYQKIVFLSSYGFLVVPSEAVAHADGWDFVLSGY